jgi:glyoxylase-like metal-dependent hydrolase (beta-lactamase superfamily II)
MATFTPDTDLAIARLHATTPQAMSFAPSLHIRAFLLEREQGNVLVYSTGLLDGDADGIAARGGITRQYLNHWHEAMFGLAPAPLGARLVHHEAETPHVVRRGGHGVTFSRRHHLDGDLEAIPTPGHTSGATAYLWDTGEHRLLFTGDTVYVREGEWVAAVLEGSSDRERYLESLALIRDLDFDVLVPWAASADGPAVSRVDPDERRARIDAIIARVRAGGDS